MVRPTSAELKLCEEASHDHLGVVHQIRTAAQVTGGSALALLTEVDDLDGIIRVEDHALWELQRQEREIKTAIEATREGRERTMAERARRYAALFTLVGRR